MPVILQAGSSSFAAVGRSLLAATALAMAKESPSPVGVHLDHATDLTEIRACIELGYSSVMIDGSHRSFEENVEVTSLVVAEAHGRGVWVEAELGAIAGEENVSGRGRGVRADVPGDCGRVRRAHRSGCARGRHRIRSRHLGPPRAP